MSGSGAGVDDIAPNSKYEEGGDSDDESDDRNYVQHRWVRNIKVYFPVRPPIVTSQDFWWL